MTTTDGSEQNNTAPTLCRRASNNSRLVDICSLRRLILLLRPRERWRSIVMSASVCMYVCLCVCLSVCPRALSPEPHAQFLPNICACCLSPWFGPPHGLLPGPFLLIELLGFCFIFPYFFVSVSCARLSWPSCQRLSAR